MVDVTVGALDKVGIIKDLPSYDVAPNGFTDGENIQFNEGGVRPLVKEVQIFSGPLFDPWFIEAATFGNVSTVWYYMGAAKAGLVSNFAHIDITRTSGDYTANREQGWNGGIFQGIPVFNNGFDIPQQSDPNDPSLSLIDMDNWPVGLRFEVLRPFGTFLIGLVLNNTGIFDHQTLAWSDTSDPGEVPPNWDFADPASKAGVKTFSEKGDRLVDCLPLRNENIIYKENSIWRQRFIGGTFVFSFALAFDEVGLLAVDCVTAFGTRHFFVSSSDLYIHNGFDISPIGHRRTKDFFFADIDPARKNFTFVQHYEQAQQIWICYCTQGSPRPDRAMIWNYEEDNLTFRDIPQVSDIAKGLLDGTVLVTWGSVTETWDTPGISDEDGSTWDASNNSWESDVSWGGQPDSVTWASQGSNQVEQSLVLVTDVNGVAPTYDALTNMSEAAGVEYAGNDDRPPFWHVPVQGERFQGRVQRKGLAIAGKDQEGKPTVNRTINKTFTELWPEVEGTVEIRLGTHDTPNGDIRWEEWKAFVALEDIKLDFFATAKFLAMEVRGMEGSSDDWLFSGYQLALEADGRY